MALLFMDGADHYATADLYNKWTNFWGGGANLSINATAGRRGGGALQGLNDSRGPEKTVTTASDTCIVGFAYKSAALPGGTVEFIHISDSSVQHITVNITVAGLFEVRRGATFGTVLGTSSVGLTAGIYTYVEVKVKISDTVGTVEIRLNGSATPILNLTGQDTRNGGTAGWSRVGVAPSINSTGYIDDLYIADAAGSLNNDFLGDVRVDAHYPTANGNTGNSTPSTGTDRAATVDETAPNTTDYNTLTAINDKDTLVLANLIPTGSVIKGIQTSAYALKTDAGAASLALVTRSGGTDYDGASVALATAYNYVNEVRETDPATAAAWTETNFNALEIGYKRTA